MSRAVGTVVRGLRAPIIQQGDDLLTILTETVLRAVEQEHITLRDRDIVAVTEAVVAKAQGNYAMIDDIAQDVQDKLGSEVIGAVFPILSRNRFASSLSAVARAAKKVVLQLSYPSDEVGNHLISLDQIDAAGLNPWCDVLTEAEFRAHFGVTRHFFTGLDYISYYREVIEREGCEAVILFANDPREILKHTGRVLACDIHTRERTKRLLREGGAERVLGLDDLLTSSVGDSGFNPVYGLLGANRATEERVKLFPRDGQAFVEQAAKNLREATGRKLEVMIYGDGAFKDSVGKVWELADPVVSPAYTDGLDGLPSEIKLKYLADSAFAHLRGEALCNAVIHSIQHKDELEGGMISQGTTPRRLTDLIGSLCDLTSGSGDKGTPFILVQGYFDNYAANGQ
ncbi:MAG: F420-0--gamma-glutamyl ligase [Clostridiales bacterium]|nr:F420-0--gamma-glutamyl ligase [Clostridiales bacterium]